MKGYADHKLINAVNMCKYKEIEAISKQADVRKRKINQD